jgi:arylsulfatase A-like enzyme
MRTFLALFALACVAPAKDAPAQEKNVLVIIADDLGYADLAAVGKAGYASNINALAAAGVVFDHCFVQPTCSPTRDGVHTSRWGGKLDGTPCVNLSGYEIPLALTTLPELANDTHATALFGKYHLGPEEGVELEDLALALGYEFWCGVAANLIECDSESYTSWEHIHGGTSTSSTDYEPRVILDDLKAWWTETEGQKLAVWCPALPHGPMHRPPDAELPANYPATSTQREKYEAMIATLDMHVGEILATIDLETTLVIFLGDNGTPSNVAPAGFAAKCKGTTYERGIHVPCVLAAPGVGMGLSSRMVSNADIIPTVCAHLGVSVPQGIAGVSMGAPSTTRPYTISIDYFDNVAPAYSSACLRTATFKFMLIDWHTATPEERFYSLTNDPDETIDLGPTSHQATQDLMRTALLAALPK